MPTETLKCPECGSTNTSEYQEDRWQCLDCSVKFKYSREALPAQINQDFTTRIEKQYVAGEPNFICSHCGGEFSLAVSPRFTCPLCKRTFCGKHANFERCRDCKQNVCHEDRDFVGTVIYCRKCLAKIRAEESAQERIWEAQAKKNDKVAWGVGIAIVVPAVCVLCYLAYSEHNRLNRKNAANDARMEAIDVVSEHTYLLDLEGKGIRQYHVHARYQECGEANTVSLRLDNGTTYVLIDSAEKKDIRNSTVEQLGSVLLEEIVIKSARGKDVHLYRDSDAEGVFERLTPVFGYVARYQRARLLYEW